MIIVIIKYNKLPFTEIFISVKQCNKHCLYDLNPYNSEVGTIIILILQKRKIKEIEQVWKKKETFNRNSSCLFFKFFVIFLLVLCCYLRDLSKATLQCNERTSIRTQLHENSFFITRGTLECFIITTDLFKTIDP